MKKSNFHELKRKGGAQKGFTLAELLIVMAIIAVLAAVAIPSFSRQLESARETSDLNAVRAAYSEATTLYMTKYSVSWPTFVSGGSVKPMPGIMFYKEMDWRQKTNGWQYVDPSADTMPWDTTANTFYGYPANSAGKSVLLYRKHGIV